MNVGNHFRKITQQADAVRMDDSIDAVIRALCERYETRTVHVVDERNKLVGTIDTSHVLRLAAIKDVKADPFTMLGDLLARTAADIMAEPVSVTPQDTMQDALALAVANDLQDLPVVDEDDHLLGELNCFEILGYLQAHKPGGR